MDIRRFITDDLLRKLRIPWHFIDAFKLLFEGSFLLEGEQVVPDFWEGDPEVGAFSVDVLKVDP